MKKTIKVIRLSINFNIYYIINDGSNSFQVIDNEKIFIKLLGRPHDEEYKIRYVYDYDEYMEPILEYLNFTRDEEVDIQKLVWNTLCYILLCSNKKYSGYIDRLKIFEAMWECGSTGEEDDE